MKRIKYVILSSLCLISLYSCEILDTNSTDNVAAKLEGKWQVTESSSLFKNAADAYSVYINIDVIDSSTVYISNFYQLGGTFDVTANINGYSLDLPSQVVDGNIFEGTGSISKNYKTINWSYTVEMESGDTDNVTAVYEKIE